ncbi:TonB-dependent receptor [Sphingomonas sp. MG17]|uniref:TonB-dependent receptor n=1 Tax=Sphingomonas tagetis TaxID=2949092 RepID=A0A9X2KKK7_9SPHN|nr:TonB-dependent receptor [Sphingomonas tagetis]MCP3729476.1 TonB-dependent receptor [Sphingomonas tagetis]
MRQRLVFRRSLFLAAAGSALITAPALAQDTPAAAPAEEEEAIVVTGIRAAERAAIDIKRNSVSVVDSIVAEDLGKLPDQNVAESLQRITGVTIERNRGEGRFVTVRGFGPKFNAVTVNGRTLATDNNGREFSFDVIPSEVISGADVYKSPQANFMGSSIGATINVKTLRPLDQKEGFKVAASATGMYSELAKSWNPEFSGVASWKNESGSFGVALAGVYSEQESRYDEFTIGAGHVKRGSLAANAAAGRPANEYWFGRLAAGVTPFTGVDAPSNLSPFFFERDLTRWAVNGSVQMRPSETLTVTVDTLYSRARFREQQTGLAYDFSGGTLAEHVVSGGSIVNGVQTGGKTLYQRVTGGFVDQIIQYDDRNVTTDQFGINIDWNPTDTLRVRLDGSVSDARRRGKENNLFTTIRRKNIDYSYDRRSGSPIYDYTLSSPNYANAATSSQGITAHYYIWGGGSNIDDEIEEYKADVEWNPGKGDLTFYAGLFKQSRIKTITADEMPFGEQCAYCGSDRVLPAALFSPTNRNFFEGSGGNILRDWVIYDPRALVLQVDQFATADGRTFNPATPSASASSQVNEKVWGGYLMASLDTEVGGLPLAVNVGLRYEDTDYTSAGASRTILSAVPNGQGQNIITVSPIVPVSFRGKYRDWLPSLNARLNLTDDLLVRIAASKVMTRPTLSDLSPRQTIQTNPGNETIRRGNPDLQPFRANQVEGGVEWYFAPGSLISAAAFYKDIQSFVTLTTSPQRVDQVTFQVTVPSNGAGAVVKGFEIGYRQSFDNWLPAPFDGFGVQASYNFTDSNAEYRNAVANVTFGLEGLSKNSYSLVGFYEKYGLTARVAYTYRDNFLQIASGRNGEPEYFDAYGQLDVGVSYDITKNFTVFADAVNLNNAKEFIYSVSEDRTKEYRTTGRRISAGVRTRF